MVRYMRCTSVHLSAAQKTCMSTSQHISCNWSVGRVSFYHMITCVRNSKHNVVSRLVMCNSTTLQQRTGAFPVSPGRGGEFWKGEPTKNSIWGPQPSPARRGQDMARHVYHGTQSHNWRVIKTNKRQVIQQRHWALCTLKSQPSSETNMLPLCRHQMVRARSWARTWMMWRSSLFRTRWSSRRRVQLPPTAQAFRVRRPLGLDWRWCP